MAVCLILFLRPSPPPSLTENAIDYMETQDIDRPCHGPIGMSGLHTHTQSHFRNNDNLSKFLVPFPELLSLTILPTDGLSEASHHQP